MEQATLQGSAPPAGERWPSLLAPQGSHDNEKAWGHHLNKSHLNKSISMHAGCTPAWAKPGSCPRRLPGSTQASSISVTQHIKAKVTLESPTLANHAVQVPSGPTVFEMLQETDYPWAWNFASRCTPWPPLHTSGTNRDGAEQREKPHSAL